MPRRLGWGMVDGKGAKSGKKIPVKFEKNKGRKKGRATGDPSSGSVTSQASALVCTCDGSDCGQNCGGHCGVKVTRENAAPGTFSD